jgi:hypothetical protein
MKGRYIKLRGGQKTPSRIFDRNCLVDGTTHDGKYVPNGGVILTNGNLAGYVNYPQKGKTWTVIGKIDLNDPNYANIPNHQSGGNMKKFKTSKNKIKQGGSDERPVSLKTAVKMLREYYRINFN